MQIDLQQQYSDTGHILIPGLLDAQRTARLRVTAEHCLCQWRIKTASQHPDAISMSHLNDPAYYENSQKPWLAELLDIAADPAVLAVAEEVLGGKPMFRSIQLFFNPLLSSREGNWHRDSQFLRPKRDEEDQMILEEARKAQSGLTSAIQLQIALVPSDDIQYVPGSHLRLDTPDENYIRFAENQKFNGSNLMPGTIRTHQEPGDAAVFNPWGLHRGRYHAEKSRRALLLTYTAGQRYHLEDTFSDQPWCLSENYLDGVKPETKTFFNEFIAAYRPFWNRKR